MRYTLCIVLKAALLLRASGHECSQQAKAIGDDTRPGDYFGGKVSISGDTVVSVAANEDGIADDSGAAYVFIRRGIKWSQEAKLVGNDTTTKHHFGRSVSISGDYVVIGSRTYIGSAYVFARADTTWGPLWSEQTKLEASDKRAGDEFGFAVGILGDIIVVGAPNGNTAIGNYAGAAYIFRRTGSKWIQEAKVWGLDTLAGQYFGGAIAITGGPSGTTVVVGTSATVLGAVYVFTRSAALTWTQQAKIYRNGAFGGDSFGASLSIHHDTLVVGAPGDDEGFNDAGAAYIFTRTATSWNQTAKVVAADKSEDQRFGSSVGISDSTLAVVAQGARDQAGNYGGNVYVFAKAASGSMWSQQVKVQGTDTAFGDRFGASVSVSDNYVASGAPRENTGGTSAGAAYFLKCVTTTTSTPLPVVDVTTRPSSDKLANLKTKAVTSGVGETPWSSRWLALVFVLMPFGTM